MRWSRIRFLPAKGFYIMNSIENLYTYNYYFFDIFTNLAVMAFSYIYFISYYNIILFILVLIKKIFFLIDLSSPVSFRERMQLSMIILARWFHT
jgi:hypothetical protein